MWVCVYLCTAPSSRHTWGAKGNQMGTPSWQPKPQRWQTLSSVRLDTRGQSTCSPGALSHLPFPTLAHSKPWGHWLTQAKTDCATCNPPCNEKWSPETLACPDTLSHPVLDGQNSWSNNTLYQEYPPDIWLWAHPLALMRVLRRIMKTWVWRW